MRAKRLWFPALVTVLVALVTCTVGWANEIQLAGVRLGQHAHNVMQVYGQPDCVILGTTGPGSVGFAGGGAPAAAAGGAEAAGGAPGGMTPGAQAAGPGLGGMMGGMLGGMLGGMMGGEMGGMPGGPGGAAPGGAPGGEMGAGMGGAPAASAGGGGGGRFAVTQDIPDWAAPVQVQMTTKEQMWCYRRKGIALAFILDRDGYVVKIAVAGKKADWIRTAMGEPKRTIKLGDDFQKVVERYGYPESINNMGGDGFSRDAVLHFGYANNIAFTLREMKVVSIRIWETDLRGTAPVRLPAPGISASPTRSGLPAAVTAPEGFRD